MHPYYGSTSLYGASPTPIETVEAEEIEMNAAHLQGTGSNSLSGNHISPDLGNGTMNVQVQNLTNHSELPDMPDVVPSLTPSTGQILDLHLQSSRTQTTLTGSSYYPQYQPTPVSSQPRVIHFPLPRPVAGVSRPVPTSTHCVKFTSPSMTNSYSNSTLSSYSLTPVSFHFSSPTFSTPPVQMIAPKTECRRQPWHMSVPTSMPWAIPGPIPSSSIQFTAESCSHTSVTTSSIVSSLAGKRSNKRKSSGDGGLPEKVHINEEKMAARLEEMHLDNNNLQWHPDFEEQWYTQRRDPEPPGKGKENSRDSDDDNEDLSRRSARNSLSASSELNFSEMLKIGMKSREILPKVIMQEINKPNMQIVLWKPPGDFVHEVVKQVAEANSQSRDMNDVSDISDGMVELGVNKDQIMEQPVFPSISQLSWLSQNGQAENGDGSNDMES